MNQPDVSVNITTRNRSELLIRCVESVRRQTIKNLDINVLDDASTDNTRHTMAILSAKDTRIRYFYNKKRLGNAASRNRLLTNTRTSLICFLDDDDYWTDERKIQKQTQLIAELDKNSKPVVCFTGVILEKAHGLEPLILKMPQRADHAILAGNGFIFNSTVMTTRNTLDLVGGFDELMKRGVDSDFFRRAILQLKCDLIFHDAATTVCRVFGERMTQSRSIQDRTDRLQSHMRIISKYRWHFLKNPYILLVRIKKALSTFLKTA